MDDSAGFYTISLLPLYSQFPIQIQWEHEFRPIKSEYRYLSDRYVQTILYQRRPAVHVRVAWNIQLAKAPKVEAEGPSRRHCPLCQQNHSFPFRYTFNHLTVSLPNTSSFPSNSPCPQSKGRLLFRFKETQEFRRSTFCSLNPQFANSKSTRDPQKLPFTYT